MLFIFLIWHPVNRFYLLKMDWWNLKSWCWYHFNSWKDICVYIYIYNIYIYIYIERENIYIYTHVYTYNNRSNNFSLRYVLQGDPDLGISWDGYKLLWMTIHWPQTPLENNKMINNTFDHSRQWGYCYCQMKTGQLQKENSSHRSDNKILSTYFDTKFHF